MSKDKIILGTRYNSCQAGLAIESNTITEGFIMDKND